MLGRLSGGGAKSKEATWLLHYPWGAWLRMVGTWRMHEGTWEEGVNGVKGGAWL